MLQGDNTRTIAVNGLKDDQKQRIEDFLQGAVYCWCKNRKGEWFSARDFLGGDNFNWEHSPLDILYTRHKDAGMDREYAFDQAAKDAGKILKRLLAKDNRTFETEGGFTRRYRWIK